ncbi:MAG: hypothetical protein F8N37_16595 [Telmatospirillum sp.]|nr:hypothetical protein [Telmatospirillum sp.]
MRYDAEQRKMLDLMQARAARKLDEIHQILAPGIAQSAGEEELRRQADAHMASLPPEEQEKLRLKAIVAYSQLERLISEMSEHLADIGDELKRVNSQSRAVGAYSRTVKMNRHGPMPY